MSREPASSHSLGRGGRAGVPAAARLARACLFIFFALLVGLMVLAPASATPGQPPRNYSLNAGSGQVETADHVMAAFNCLPPTPPPSIEPSTTPEPTESPSEQPSDSPSPNPSDSPGPSPTPSAPPTPTPSPSPTPAPTATPTWGPPPAPRLGSPEIFGYYVNWDLNAQIDYGAITTIAYFGLGAGSDGHLIRNDASGYSTEYSRWLGSKVTSAIAQAHANGDKFVLTVERMAWDDGGRASTRSLMNNPTKRMTLVADIVSEIQSRGVDGVSLDFEPILSDQRDNFADFVRQLRAALYVANPAYQLTFAATGSQPGQTYQMIGNVTASGAADAVLVMAYPLRAIDAKYAGGLAPLYSATSYDLKQITSAYLNQVAPDKIVMALPWYGREWPTVSNDVNALVQPDRGQFDRPYNISYSSAIQVAQQYGRQVDPVEMSAYTQYRWVPGEGCPETWQQVYYDDVDTLGYKADWVASKGLAGIGIFALGYDDAQPELWKMLRVKYRGLVDHAAPAGQVSIAPDEKFCHPESAAVDLSADDGPAGSGAVFVRLSNSPATASDGTLAQGRTYPTTASVNWPLDDATLGGSAALGPRQVYAQWRDVAGNWSAPTSVAFNLGAPAVASVTVGNGSGYTTAATVPIAVAQSSGRAIGRVVASSSAVTVNGVLAQAQDLEVGQLGQITLPVSDTPQHVYVQWQDVNGCWSSVQDNTVTVDSTAPVGSLSIANGASTSLDGNVQLLAPATDAGSGVANLELSNDGIAWKLLPVSTTPVNWSAGTIQDGPWTISARWRDAAGNASDPQTVTIALERNGPSGTLSINGGALFARSTTVQVQPLTSSTGSPATKFVLSNDNVQSGGALVHGQQFAPGAAVPWALAGSGDGPRTIYGQWQDALGRWSPVVSATVTIDRTAPQVATPFPALVVGSRLAGSGIQVGVTTQVTDAGSGVAQTTTESSRNGGSWTQLGQGVTPGSSVQVDTTGTWQLRASAIDAAGNVSAATAGRSFKAVVTEDSGKSIVYSGKWTKASNSSASSGSTRYATAKGASATMTFTGSSVAWIAPTSAKYGKAKVFIDGVLVSTVDLGSAAQTKLAVFAKTWSTSGKHTIKIKVVGSKGRARVDIDAFIVLA